MKLFETKLRFGLLLFLIPLITIAIVFTNSTKTKASINSTITVAATNNAKSATSDYTIEFTPATAIEGFASINIGFNAPPDSPFNIASVQSSGLGTGTSAEFTGISHVETQWASVGISANNGLTASAKTIVLKNIVNPNKSGNYTVRIETWSGFTQTETGQGSIQIGTIALQGTVSKPASAGGGGVGDVWVEAQDKANWSQRFGSQSSSDGSYGIGDLVSGHTYIVQTFVNNYQGSAAQGLSSADSVEIVYNGTPLTQNFILKQPTKTVTGTVKRSNGVAIANARISANRTDQPGWQSTEADASGNYTFLLSGGSWELRPDTWVGPGQAALDYTFGGPGSMVKFAKDETSESRTGINFTVVTANSTITGSVTPSPGGFSGIGIFNRGGFGTGTGVDPNNGSFSVTVPAGTYQVDFFSDPSAAGDRYAMPEMPPITVGENETKSLGTINLIKMDKTITASVKEKGGTTGLGNFEVFCFKPRGGGFSNGRTDSAGNATVKVTSGEWGCMAMSGMGMKGEEGPGPMAMLRSWVKKMTETAYAQSPGGQEQSSYVVMGGPKFIKVTSTASIQFEAVKADRTITAVVTDPDNNPISEHGFIEAELISSDQGDEFDKGGGLGSPIDPNQPGMATIKVPAGVYYLRMMTPPGSDYSSGDATKVDVSSATEAVAYIKLLRNDSTIVGSLKDEDGNIVTDVPAFVSATNAKGAFIPGDAYAGAYSMRVPSAGGQLNLGYFVDPDSGYFPQPVTDNVITPVANQTLTRDIVMKKATTTVNFTVKDPSGAAIEGAFVEADNRKFERGFDMGGMFNIGEKTNASGNVTLRLPEGEFTFSAFLPPETLRGNKWLPPKGTKVVLAEGETKSVTLQFQAADVEIVGTVTKQDTTVIDGAYITAYSKDGESIEVETDANGNYNLFVTKNEWHFVAEKDESASGSEGAPEPLVSDDVGYDTSAGGKFDIDLTCKDLSDMSTPISASFDSDNAKQITLSDGYLAGAKLSIPQDALDTDGEGSSVTVNVSTTVEIPRQLMDKPLGGQALDITAMDSSGQDLTSTASSVAITIPVLQSDLTSAGLDSDDIGTKANMSYYDTTNGKWTPLEGSVTKMASDANGDGDTTDSTDYVLVTGQSSHFTAFAVTAATDTIPPSAPTNIAASDYKTGGKIKLTWTNPTDSDFAQIKIYRSTTEGTLGTGTVVNSSSTTEYLDRDLTDGTKYFYTVKSVDTSSNESTNTSQVSATPSAAELPKTGANPLSILLARFLQAD